MMKRTPMPITLASSSSSMYPKNNSVMPDLLWISKQQQQHPLTHAHPLKNTVRVTTTGVRHKFDGKQWRFLCKSSDGIECRNLAFRSCLCQKHFYKTHLIKRPYTRPTSLSTSTSSIPSAALKRSVSNSYECHNEQSATDNSCKHLSEDDENSIEVLDHPDFKIIKRDKNNDFQNKSQLDFNFFSIDCDQQSELNTKEIHPAKVESSPKQKPVDSTSNDCPITNETDNASLNISIPKVTESIRLGIPPLTRTEEKSLVIELIAHLPADASLQMADQLARRRVCEIMMDNYSCQITPINIASDWFYDFLLRNPRLPIHFQVWFSSVKPTLPSSDQLIDVKIWELGLVTRSIIPSSSFSTSSSSP